MSLLRLIYAVAFIASCRASGVTHFAPALKSVAVVRYSPYYNFPNGVRSIHTVVPQLFSPAQPPLIAPAGPPVYAPPAPVFDPAPTPVFAPAPAPVFAPAPAPVLAVRPPLFAAAPAPVFGPAPLPVFAPAPVPAAVLPAPAPVFGSFLPRHLPPTVPVLPAVQGGNFARVIRLGPALPESLPVPFIRNPLISPHVHIYGKSFGPAPSLNQLAWK